MNFITFLLYIWLSVGPWPVMKILRRFYSIFQMYFLNLRYNAKEKYRGVFEIQKSGDKTSSGVFVFVTQTYICDPVSKAYNNKIV